MFQISLLWQVFVLLLLISIIFGNIFWAMWFCAMLVCLTCLTEVTIWLAKRKCGTTSTIFETGELNVFLSIHYNLRTYRVTLKTMDGKGKKYYFITRNEFEANKQYTVVQMFDNWLVEKEEK